MHKEKVIVEGKEIEVDTFDTSLHLTKGKKHLLADLNRFCKEVDKEELNNGGKEK